MFLRSRGSCYIFPSTRHLKGSEELDVYFSNTRLAFKNQYNNIPCGLAWNAALFILKPALPLNAVSFFPPRVWRRRRRPRRAREQVSKGRAGRWKRARKAELNKALEYYPKLKDIHTCQESSLTPSSPPPPAPPASFLSRCGLVSMATGGFLFQVRSSDGETRSLARAEDH